MYIHFTKTGKISREVLPGWIGTFDVPDKEVVQLEASFACKLSFNEAKKIITKFPMVKPTKVEMMRPEKRYFNLLGGRFEAPLYTHKGVAYVASPPYAVPIETLHVYGGRLHYIPEIKSDLTGTELPHPMVLRKSDVVFPPELLQEDPGNLAGISEAKEAFIWSSLIYYNARNEYERTLEINVEKKTPVRAVGIPHTELKLPFGAIRAGLPNPLGATEVYGDDHGLEEPPGMEYQFQYVKGSSYQEVFEKQPRPMKADLIRKYNLTGWEIVGEWAYYPPLFYIPNCEQFCETRY